MKIVRNPSGDYPDCFVSRMNLEQFSDNSTDSVLFYGYASSIDTALRRKYRNYKNRFYLNTEAPTNLCAGPHSTFGNNVQQQEYFTKVFSICPYTCDWSNNVLKTQAKYTPIYYPSNETIFAEYANKSYDKDKVVDVIYCGQCFAIFHLQLIEMISKYKYVWTTPQFPLPLLATHSNVSSDIQWALMNRSKVTVIANILAVRPEHTVSLENFPEIRKNKCFSHIDIISYKHDKTRLAPQLKTRCFEAAMCKSLMMVWKDAWNVIEYWFKENEDFVYWTDGEDFHEKIQYILNHYDECEGMIESAHRKVMNYTSERFVRFAETEI